MSETIATLKKLAIEQGMDAIDVDVLLSFVLEKDRSFLFAWPEKALTDQQLKNFSDLQSRRLSGEPIAYLTGEREFWSLNFLTSPSTLIPRADTEVLVEAVLEHFDTKPLTCVDLGTGTGAIALALKSERPGWQIQGVDRIAESVELATKNAKQLALDVQFIQSSWCDDLTDASLDIIVSNPPYIDKDDPHLNEGDVRFEPSSALVADDNGLSDIEIIAREGVRCLREDGGLFLEHGWQQAEDVQNILRQYGYWDIKTLKDYAGNDRVTLGFK